MSDSAPALPVFGEAVGPFDGNHPPPLDFEAWADTSAALMRRDPNEALDILNDRKIDIELWDACNLFWLDELATQLRRGNGKLATRYGRRCAKELQSRCALVGSDEDNVNLEETAFMTALHDDLVLPFEPSLVGQPSIAESDSTPASNEQIDAGETQQVSTLTSQDLPFEKSE